MELAKQVGHRPPLNPGGGEIDLDKWSCPQVTNPSFHCITNADTKKGNFTAPCSSGVEL